MCARPCLRLRALMRSLLRHVRVCVGECELCELFELCARVCVYVGDAGWRLWALLLTCK